MGDNYAESTAAVDTSTSTTTTRTGSGSGMRERLRGADFDQGASLVWPGQPGAPVAVNPTAAASVNQGLGFGADSVRLLRRALGMGRRGGLGAAFASGLAAWQTANGLAGNGLLNWDTVRRIPMARRPRGAIGWYTRAPGPWGEIPEDQRDATSAQICAAIGCSSGDLSWETTRRGRVRLVVTEAFVNHAAAWQVWQRSGMDVDGRLGNTAFVRMGRPVGESAGRNVHLNASDTRGGGDPRLAAASRQNTFTGRMLGLETNNGRRGRLDELRGEVSPTVGTLPGSTSPRALLEALYASDPELVRAHLFPNGGGDTLQEVLAAVGLAPQSAPDAPDRLSGMAGSAGYDGFMALLRTPQAAALQIAEYQRNVVGAVEQTAGEMTTNPTYGTVALLSVIHGYDPSLIPIDSPRSRQMALISEYIEPDLVGLDARVQTVMREFMDATFVHYAEGNGAAPAYGEMARALEDAEGASIGFPINDSGEYQLPGRLAQVQRILARFGDVWFTAYAGADVDLAQFRAPSPGGVVAGQSGPSHVAPAEGTASNAQATGPIANGRPLIAALDSIRLRHPPLNPEWTARLQTALGVAAEGRINDVTVQALATYQQTTGVARGRQLGRLTAQTVARLNTDHPTLAEVDMDFQGEPIAESSDNLTHRAETIERPIHEAAYNELQASENRIAGLPATWDDFIGQMTVGDFLGNAVTGHPLFLQRLAVAATYVRGRYPDKNDSEINRDLGIGIRATNRSQLRADAGTSFHNFGFAVDISVVSNPWIGGMEGMSGADGARTHRNAVAPANLATIHAIWRANWLMGQGMPVHPAETHERTRTETTDQIWAHFNASDQALEGYYALRGNTAGITALLGNLQNAPPALPPELAVSDGMIESLRAGDAAAWDAQMATDFDATHGRGTNYSTYRGAETGFMSHSLELTRGMRDAAGLSWGACDMYASSGDFMHFDGRTIPGVLQLKNHIRAAKRRAR